MGIFSNYFADHWLLPAMLIFLFLGSIFAFVVGLGLLLRVEAMFRFFAYMNRWISTRKFEEAAEAPRYADQSFQSRWRVLGVVLVAGAGVSLWILVDRFDVKAVVSVLRRYYDPLWIELAANAAKMFLLTAHVAAIAVGIAMIFFPVALKALETRANRWYSVKHLDDGLNVVHTGIDDLVRTHPRVFGACIAVLSAFVVMNLSSVLLLHR